MLTLSQAAKVTGSSRATIYRALKEGLSELEGARESIPVLERELAKSEGLQVRKQLRL